MKFKKIAFGILAFVLVFNTLAINSNVFAKSIVYIKLSDTGITVDGTSITTDSSKGVYLTNSMDNGGSSDDAVNANIEIEKVINISESGTYEFSGSLSDGQISVNSNNIKGDVVIVLNNVDITCKEAPAIFVYNKDTTSSNCNVILKLASGSQNVLSGGKIKQSVEGWNNQDLLLYYIEKDYDDDGTYYERYKYDGVISSDISLTFEGEGTLTINSLKKEGIETKKDLTINSGKYIINSLDDGINTSADNESVITINGGEVLVNVTSEAEEGDGIDSNGSIYINGGKVFAYASEKSQDNGVDADKGIYINGGYVVATGNMADAVSSDSSQKHVQIQFNDKIEKNELITITDENDNALVAFKSDRSYSILTISAKNLTDNFKVYIGGTIEGEETNGLYINITSYTLGTEKEYSSVEEGRMNGMDIKNENSSNLYIYTIIILSILLVTFIITLIILKKKGEFEMKGKWLTLIIGILIGAILATGGFMIYNSVNSSSNRSGMEQMQGGPGGNAQMPGNGETPPDMPSQNTNTETNTTQE